MQKYFRMQTCGTHGVPKMQEGNSLEQRLQYGPICVLEPAFTELTLDAIWGKYEEYCKPQSNEVCARFNLLMSFHQDNFAVQMNGTMPYRH